MKKVTSIACALAIVAMLIFNGTIYSTTCVIVDTDYETDTVTMSTASGYLYQFEGIEDYWNGDLVSVIMYNNGTPEIIDDVILSHRYVGWTELFDEVMETYEKGE